MPRELSRASAADQLAAVRLVNECMEQGDDAQVWQRHLITGLTRLTKGAVAAVGPIPPHQAARIDTVTHWVSHQVGGGWPSEAARSMCEQMIGNPAVVQHHPAVARFFDLPEPDLTRTRRELVADRVWDLSPLVNDLLRANELDEGLVSRAAVPGVGCGYLLTVVRAVRDRPFAPRDGRVVEAVMRVLSPHLGRGLLLTTQPNLHGLTPRQRQVLGCLLDGDSEKEAGLRLGLATGTVHVHVKRVYAHFGVNSRAELLAYFLRRYRRPE